MNLIASGVVPTQTKWAFTTRRVTRSDAVGLNPHVVRAGSGDLLLGQVVELGQHKKLQLAEGRYSESYVGDHVVLACGDRYAPDQFEAAAELGPELADLVAGGGIVGRMQAAHDRMDPPTKIRPLGLLTNAGGDVINIDQYALPYGRDTSQILVIGVVGASMNAGKTTAAASLAHGLARYGHRVAALKVTGTGAFGDFNAYRDAGIAIVADFTDAGMASTYRQPVDRIERGFETLISHAADHGADVAVIELADGVFQRETVQILEASSIRNRLAGLLFATPDALGAVGGYTRLAELGLTPFAISGKVSRSPLASAEAQSAVPVPIVSREQLRDPDHANRLIASLGCRRNLPANTGGRAVNFKSAA